MLPDKHHGSPAIARYLAVGQRSRSALAVRSSVSKSGKVMSNAQLGLLTATPIIILFAGALRAMGVLSTTATVSAVGLSVAIAVVLFTTQ